jgi:hypothetical protein
LPRKTICGKRRGCTADTTGGLNLLSPLRRWRAEESH